jgi:flagella basal body P-ring formation protein FlgA
MTKRFLVTAMTACLAVTASTVPVAQAARVSAAASDAIRDAVIARVGQDADVTILSIDQEAASLSVRDARPDPAARLGSPMRFSLTTAAGATMAVTVDLKVIATHLVTREEIGRGHAVEAAMVEERRTELKGIPLARLVARSEALGARALRPIPAGSIVLPSLIAMKRLVEAGQAVTVIALAGPIEVSATFVAADGGGIGDVIRVKNPESRRFIRGRIVRAAAPFPIVEVINER